MVKPCKPKNEIRYDIFLDVPCLSVDHNVGQKYPTLDVKHEIANCFSIVLKSRETKSTSI